MARWASLIPVLTTLAGCAASTAPPDLDVERGVVILEGETGEEHDLGLCPVVGGDICAQLGNVPLCPKTLRSPCSTDVRKLCGEAAMGALLYSITRGDTRRVNDFYPSQNDIPVCLAPALL